MDLVELDEAFAAQVLACLREWGFTAADLDRVDVNGSGTPSAQSARPIEVRPSAGGPPG
jgi:acetyl-CoA acetyltransferase